MNIVFLQQYRSLESNTTKHSVRVVDSEHFLLPFDDISQNFKPQHSVRMEIFIENAPALQHIDGRRWPARRGSWNYDSANRNKLKRKTWTPFQRLCAFNTTCVICSNVLRRPRHCVYWSCRAWLALPLHAKMRWNLLAYFLRAFIAELWALSRFNDKPNPHTVGACTTRVCPLL